ncbi:unnamed protein product, partial [Discosporangium mesarthrocarpum]
MLSVAVCAVLWCGLAPLLAGAIFQGAFVVTSEAWEDHGLGALDAPGCYVVGSALLHLWAYLCHTGVLGG